MFLDFSDAFDEINMQAILRVAEMYPFLRGVVHEVVHHYMSFRQYVVSALSLSESYCQVEGVLQGGGLDPLFYILAVNLIHLAMRQRGVGIPVCVPPSVEMIAYKVVSNGHQQAARVPVSVGVAHTVIEGLVVNRLVFCCCVNVPTDVQISDRVHMQSIQTGLWVGSQYSTCLHSFHSRKSCPRSCPLGHINELFKSLNGPNALLVCGHTGRTRACIALTATLSAFGPGSKAWAFSFANSCQVKGLSGV